MKLKNRKEILEVNKNERMKSLIMLFDEQNGRCRNGIEMNEIDGIKLTMDFFRRFSL